MMVYMDSLLNKSWWDEIERDIRELLSESLLLYDVAIKWGERNINFHDYSFIVFPAAKAYEGYLKNVFYKKGFITEEEYRGKRFRVGKALNPSLEKEYRERESVYDKVTEYCGGRELADRMWDTWKNCRNILFHFFPDEKNAITLSEAKVRLEELITTFDKIHKDCKTSL